MKKLHLLKTMLLLCALIVGSGTMWAGKITAAANIVAGNYYIGATTSSQDYYFSLASTNVASGVAGTAVTSSASATQVVFESGSTSGTWKIKLYGTTNYLSLSSSKNNGKVNIVAAKDAPDWTATTVNSKIRLTVNGYSLEKNTSGTQFGSYKQTVTDVWLETVATPCATPTFSLVAGEVTKNSVVTISSTTTGSTIYYTTDNSTPTTSSAHGTAGEASAEVTISSDMTVKAIAVKDGYGNSAVASASYTTAKATNSITVTGGAIQNIALTGGSAIEGGMYDLSDIVSATHGTVQYAIKETTNLTENTDFEFADGLFEFTNTYKGIIVVTASVPADEDYYAVEQDITINCSGDLRTPSYFFSDAEELAKESTITVANGTNITSDGAITLSTTNAEVASVNNTTKVITGVAVGSCSITVATAEGTYYASGSKTFTLNVIAVKGSAENPYTVAEAKAAIDASGTTNDVYVKGIVCTGGSNYYDSSKLNYWISDDGTTTDRFQIYRGLGVDGASFSGASDIQVGDKVTVYGDILLYNSTTYEFSEGSEIKSFFRKAESNLTLTSSTPVVLEMTTAAPHPTSTITYTTSSEGAMTFTSSDESVATVAAGVITAVGAGSATITFSQAADEAYKASSEKTVTVNVTDNRSACATGIDLSSAKTIVKGGSDAISATSTKADGFTGSITYSYVSANSSVFSITEGNYSGAGVGATTVTVTATPTGGNADNYKPASQEVAVTVNGTNSISLDVTSKSVAYGAAAFDIEATVPTENYNGTVTASSNNTSVATVSVVGTTVTVTPVAVGTATITVTAGTGTYYPVTASETCAVTVTAPEGKTTFSSLVNVFYESFNTNSGTGGNDGQWNGSIAAADFKADNTWTTSNAKGASGCAKFGTGSAGGSATTPNIDLEDGVLYTLTFKAGAWDKSGEGTSLSVSADNATIRNEANTADVSSVTMTLGAWTSYTLKLIVTDESDPANITFSTSGGNKRFFLDEVKITKSAPSTATVTLNKYGYATYCSVNPIDFTSTTGYTAWRVSSVAKDGTITFKKITEKIKGGQGVLLYNKNAEGVNTSNVTVNFANGSTEFTSSENLLVGTTAATYITTTNGDYTNFGLNGNEFIKANDGVLPANKAYLPIETSLFESGARLSIVLDDEDEATGIKNVNREDAINNRYYNINGLQVEKPKKGLYIVNGRKVVVK